LRSPEAGELGSLRTLQLGGEGRNGGGGGGDAIEWAMQSLNDVVRAPEAYELVHACSILELWICGGLKCITQVHAHPLTLVIFPAGRTLVYAE
jgi:hypothetical protein